MPLSPGGASEAVKLVRASSKNRAGPKPVKRALLDCLRVSADAPTVADGLDSWPAPARPLADDEFIPGTSLGRYLVIGELGRGAMGVVVRAYDPRLQREVALKLLRTRAMSERARARMIREARSMARLSHRNVVAVYDVEIEPSSVALAMELIDGVTLRKWLAQERGWGEVLDVFLEAGQGLVAAHRAGLLHRDFKPGNVLVELSEGSAVRRVCVTDFGLARSSGSSTSAPESSGASTPTNDPGGDSDALTVAGTVVGTPAYMAPEQHTGNDLTPAADQYAFCVALWEALTGERPFSGKSTRKIAEAKRAGPPKWPGSGDVPLRVVRVLERGLAVSPGDRFASMADLLERLERTRRRTRAKAMSTFAVVGLAAVAVAVAVQREVIDTPCQGAEAELADAWGEGPREAAERGLRSTDSKYAGDVWQRVGPALDEYAAAWTSMHREACEATSVKGVQSEHALDLRMACLARARTDLAAVARRLADADADVLANAHGLVDGLPGLQRCADIEALTAAVPPPSREIAEDVAGHREAIARARVDRAAGKVHDAIAVLEDIGPDVRAVGYPPLFTEWASLYGYALLQASRSQESETILREGLRSGLAAGQWDEVAEISADLVSVLRELARPEEGLAFAETAWGVLPRTTEPERLEAGLHSALGATYRHLARYDEAKKELELALEMRTRALGADHHLVAIARGRLANALRDSGAHDEAERAYKEALQRVSESLGDRHPAAGQLHVSLGNHYARLGDWEQAEHHTRMGIEIEEEALGPMSHRLASASANLGGILARAGRLEEALGYQRRAVEIWEAELGPNHPDVVMERGNNIAHTLMSLERFDEAEPLVRAAIDVMRGEFGLEHPRVSMLQMTLAGVLSATERYDEAEQHVRAALAARRKVLGPEDPEVASTLANLANILHHQGRNEPAAESLRAAVEIMEATVGPDHPHAKVMRDNLTVIEGAIDPD